LRLVQRLAIAGVPMVLLWVFERAQSNLVRLLFKVLVDDISL